MTTTTLKQKIDFLDVVLDALWNSEHNRVLFYAVLELQELYLAVLSRAMRLA